METDDKYLIFDTTNCYPAGLDHKLNTLKHAIKEAIRLDRVLVLRKFAIWPHQNLILGQDSKTKLSNAIVSNMYDSFAVEYKNIAFERYINLAKTEIYNLENNAGIAKIEKPLRYIDEANFDLGVYVDQPELIMKTDKLVDEFPSKEPTPINDHVLVMENNLAITAEQNKRYKVIVRRTNRFGYASGDDHLSLSFYPSDDVNRLTDTVLQHIGTSLDSVKKRFAFHHGTTIPETQNGYQKNLSCKYPLYYACLHVRANDAFYYPNIRYAADPKHLKRILKRAIPEGSVLYIMSDIGNPYYFDFLKTDYRVYQYFDFPELKALVANENKKEIDNTMLYSVEKNILQYAHIKVTRAKGSPNLIYTNSSHKIPMRYRLLSIYEYLSTNILKRDPICRTAVQDKIKHIRKALFSNRRT